MLKKMLLAHHTSTFNLQTTRLSGLHRHRQANASPHLSMQLPSKRIEVCTHTTCQERGSESLLSHLRHQAPDLLRVEPCSCLGNCKRGPRVAICSSGLQAPITLTSVTPDAVPMVSEIDSEIAAEILQ